MRALGLVTYVLLLLAACNRNGEVLHMLDADMMDGSSRPSDGSHLLDGDYLGDANGGSCPVSPWVFPTTSTEPAWVTNSCPSSGCPNGTTCVYASVAAAIVPLGCAPMPAACGGLPTCGCMGCVCGGTSTCSLPVSIQCDTPTAG